MVGILSPIQIDQTLAGQEVGRIGCFANERIYMVPITYALDGGYIYAHAREGLKIKMMRENPEVCFQVDKIENMGNWRSVIAWGTYEELKDERSYKKGMKILWERVAPMTTSHTTESGLDTSQAPMRIEKKKRAIAFRIKIREKTGRFEKN